MLTKIFWVVFSVSMAVYLAMVLWSLPLIAADAGGLVAFDLRPTGYSLEEARAFLAALSPAGNAFYRGAQHWLDFIYPPLLAASLFLAIFLLAPARPGWLKWLLAAMAIPGMVFDVLENNAVARMLLAGTDGLTPGLAAEASRWTQLKSAFVTLAMTILLVLLLIWAFRRFSARRRSV